MGYLPFQTAVKRVKEDAQSVLLRCAGDCSRHGPLLCSGNSGAGTTRFAKPRHAQRSYSYYVQLSNPSRVQAEDANSLPLERKIIDSAKMRRASGEESSPGQACGACDKAWQPVAKQSNARLARGILSMG